MSIFALIIDHRPDFISRGSQHSCGTLPINDRAWITELCERLLAGGVTEVFVTPPHGENDGYREQIRSTGAAVRIMSRESIRGFAGRCEPADQILIFDGRYFISSSMNLTDFLAGSRSMTRHWVRLAGSETGTREKLVLDGAGAIVSVQRLYDGRTHLQSDGIICTIASAAVVSRIRPRHITDLRRLHSALAQRGVPSQDLSVSSKVYDLSDACQFLRLCEDLQIPVHNNSRNHSQRKTIRIGDGCEIHPSARLIAPLIINNNVKIRANSVVVGPATIGYSSIIEAGAVVANSVLLPNSIVPASTFIHESVVSGNHAHKVTARSSIGKSMEHHVTPAAACKSRLSGYGQRKAVFDYALTIAGLALISPLLALTGFLVKLTSRGTTMYGDEREGREGVPFRCLKFRTMIDGAHRQQRALYKHNRVDGPQFKLEDDPRITLIGKYLRMLNIDELPQLFNVLRGQMSLVGPRPSPFRENQVCVAWRNARLSVLPGITGLWQICRNKRDESDFHQWIHYDLLYVRHASLWLDLKILLATIATFGGKWSVPVEWILPSRTLAQKARARDAVHDRFIARTLLDANAPDNAENVSKTRLHPTECAA